MAFTTNLKPGDTVRFNCYYERGFSEGTVCKVEKITNWGGNSHHPLVLVRNIYGETTEAFSHRLELVKEEKLEYIPQYRQGDFVELVTDFAGIYKKGDIAQISYVPRSSGGLFKLRFLWHDGADIQTQMRNFKLAIAPEFRVGDTVELRGKYMDYKAGDTGVVTFVCGQYMCVTPTNPTQHYPELSGAYVYRFKRVEPKTVIGRAYVEVVPKEKKKKKDGAIKRIVTVELRKVKDGDKIIWKDRVYVVSDVLHLGGKSFIDFKGHPTTDSVDDWCIEDKSDTQVKLIKKA